MTFSAITPVGEYSGNALRFGLIDIKPIEITQTIKRCGIRLRRVVRGYESLTPSKSYHDLVKFKNDTIFSTIDIPNWFDAEKLSETFSQRSIESFNRDTELKEIVEQVRSNNRPLSAFIEYFRERCERNRERDIEVEARRFLKSNFPLSFYNKFVVFDNTFYDSLLIMQSIVRTHESRAAVARNHMMRQKVIAQMKRRLGPIIDEMDRCSFAYSCLKKYVSVWNSRDYKEVLSPEYLDFNKIDPSEYESIYNDYKMKLREARRVLLHYNPEYLKKQLMSDESTRSMIGTLVTIPSGSLRLTG